MTETMDDERDARMTLAALSEPGDIVTGTLVARFGATIVVEAGHRSGSLNVAGQAHSLGRPVGAVPGPVTSAASAGCHLLIQEGISSLVIDAQDVTDLLDSTVGFSGDRTFAYCPRDGSAGPARTSGSNRSPPNEGSIHEHTATAGPLRRRLSNAMSP